MSMEQEKPKSNSGFFTPLLVDGLAGISSLALGGVTFWREVLSESYSNLSDLGLTKGPKGARNKFGKTFLEQAGIQGWSQAQRAEKILEANNKYHADVASIFEQNGYGTFAKRMSVLNSHEMWKIGLTSLAVAGVSLGSILMLSKNLMKDSEKPDHKPEALPRPSSYTQAEESRKADKSFSQAL